VANLELRPLSLGEILDRTFSVYRRNFLLFVGITALPQLLVLCLQLVQVFWSGSGGERRDISPALGVVAVVGFFIGVIVYLVAHLFAYGGTVYAVSELYLGRRTSIAASLQSMRGQAGTLFGVLILNGLAVFAALILFIIPGIYVACRLITCVPAALLENLGPRDSLGRSFALTKDSAGRAFVIYLLYGALLYGAVLLLEFPFLFGVALSQKDPAMLRVWMSLMQVGSFLGTVLVTPILTIASTVFYYDLRVRKEAFDLQIMMNPAGTGTLQGAGVPKTLT